MMNTQNKLPMDDPSTSNDEPRRYDLLEEGCCFDTVTSDGAALVAARKERR